VALKYINIFPSKVLSKCAQIGIFGLKRNHLATLQASSEVLIPDSLSRFLTYTKLFFCMGFIWIFEIVAGLASQDIDESVW
jgi:hypothetical protein